MIQLPKGRLQTNEDGTLTAQLRASRPARKEIRAWFDRLASSRPRRVLAHRALDEGPRGLEIHYADEARGTVPVATALAEWRLDLPASLLSLLDLGRFAFEVSNELAGQGFDDALVAPGSIRLVPGSTSPWRLVPLPTRGASLADWARADPETWLWNSSETILGGHGNESVHTLGAALHDALAGQVFPEALPDREKFARLIRGRVGFPARLGVAVRSALPRSLDEEAIALEQLILDCLEPRPGSRPDPAAIRERFDALVEKLARERLIRYWGFENQPEIVAKLSAVAKQPETKAEGSPATSVPWDEQVPRLIAEGDLGGALEAAWNDILVTGPARVRFYLAVVQRIAARRPGLSTEVSSAIDRLVGSYGDRLDESDVLRVAHIRMRHLNETGTRLGIANRKFEGRWNDATARLLHARLLLRLGQSENQVSRLCKEARTLFEAMPEKGGAVGLYATAYLHLLDGIAHIGAVSTYKNDSFYADAFDGFGRALDLANRVGADDLIRSCLRWFGWLARFTKLSPDPPLSLLSAGIEGILKSQGLASDELVAAGLPDIPWYDEAKLFPL